MRHLFVVDSLDKHIQNEEEFRAAEPALVLYALGTEHLPRCSHRAGGLGDSVAT